MFAQWRKRRALARLGEPLVIVSGLPRSGTSMMMKMLEAGGLEPWTDEVRAADEDNPKGYYELERVKELDKGGDKSWVQEGRGRVLKVITHLIRELPDTCAYRVVLMRRNLDEVLQSQNKMLVHRGEDNELADAEAKEAYLRHLADIKVFMRRAPNFELLEVRYAEAIAMPVETARTVADFLEGRVDAAKMTAEVDSSLYRNRS